MTRPSRVAPYITVCAVVLALIATACGSGSSATPTPTPTPAPSSGLGGLGGLPSGLGDLGGLFGSPGASGGLLGGLAFHGDPDLESKLPAQLCGGSALKWSWPAGAIPASALSAAGANGGLGGLLGGLTGTTTFAMAMALPDPTSNTSCDTSVFALQVQNGDPNSLLSAFVQDATNEGSTSSSASVGGKSVTKVTDPSDGTSFYAYVSGDTIYGVQADTDDDAATALGSLP